MENWLWQGVEITKDNKLIIKELPDLSSPSSPFGCFIKGDIFRVHLGFPMKEFTVCGKSKKTTIIRRNITVDCPECISKFKKLEVEEVMEEVYNVLGKS
ncbi:MAG: hypothetical protein ABIG40_02475 [Parcubacteria group bacterium]